MLDDGLLPLQHACHLLATHGFHPLQHLVGDLPGLPDNPDSSFPFRLYTDASTVDLGAILAQVQDDQEGIICCTSQSINSLEHNYVATILQCLAMVWPIQKF